VQTIPTLSTPQSKLALKYVDVEMKGSDISDLLVSNFPELKDFVDFVEVQKIDGVAFQSLNHSTLESFGVTTFGFRDRILRCQMANKSDSVKLNSGDVRSVLKDLYSNGPTPIQARYKVRNGEPVCKEELYARIKKEQQRKKEENEKKDNKKNISVKILDKQKANNGTKYLLSINGQLQGYQPSSKLKKYKALLDEFDKAYDEVQLVISNESEKENINPQSLVSNSLVIDE